MGDENLDQLCDQIYADYLDWNESRKSVTAWNLAKAGINGRRRKRAYGRKKLKEKRLPNADNECSSDHLLSLETRNSSKLGSSDSNSVDTRSRHASNILTERSSKQNAEENRENFQTQSINIPNIKRVAETFKNTQARGDQNDPLHQMHRGATAFLSKLDPAERPLSPTFSAHSGSSFSSISRAGENAPTWAKQALHDCVDKMKNKNSGNHIFPKTLNRNQGSDNMDLTDLEVSSPARSVCSRKRGVCDEPLHDGLNTTGSLSISRHSTSSYGMRKSRSRIFSPETTKRLIGDDLFTIPNDEETGEQRPIFMKRGRDQCLVESDTESDNNSISIHPSASRDSHNSEESLLSKESIEEKVTDKNVNQIRLSPARTIRVSSLNGSSFAESIFAPVEVNNLETEHKSAKNPELFKNISSYNDLKFAIRELRRWKFGYQSFISFDYGMSNCTIVLPNSWSSRRKMSFCSWMTREFDFTHRFGGGTVNYLQTSTKKGMEILEKLEEALLKYKMKPKNQPKARLDTTSANLAESSKSKFQNVPLSSIKITTSTPMFPTSASCFRPFSKKYTPMSVEAITMHRDKEIDCTLMSKLNFLSIKNDNDQLDESQDDVAEPENGKLQSKEEHTSLFKSSNENRAYDSFKTIGNPSRLSFDNSVMNAQDFVSHMHGISPNDSQKISRPPHVLIPSQRRISRGSHGSIFSPYCNEHNQQITCAKSFDVVETPMIKQQEVWGSRPIPGKDWGVSMRCCTEILGILVSRYEEEIEANESSFLSEGDVDLNISQHIYSSSSCFVHPGISSTAANSLALGIDHEADNSYCSGNTDVGNDSTSSTEVENYNDNEFKHNSDSSHIAPLSRQESLGATAFADLTINGGSFHSVKVRKRKQMSLAKRQRMSICTSAYDTLGPCRFSSNKVKTFFNNRQSLPSSVAVKQHQFQLSNNGVDGCPKQVDCKDLSNSTKYELVNNDLILSFVFSFLNEKDLLCSASVTCTKWADCSTDAHAALMRVSVGCDLDLSSKVATEVDDGDYSAEISIEDNDLDVTSTSKSIAASMDRSWSYLVNKFPFGCFLSEGTFKRVYRVWNSSLSLEEAVSVMDVNLIDDKNIVAAELAVSVMLSSLARRNICPNFVLTRAVFTSMYEPPCSHWGSAKLKKPKGVQFPPTSEMTKPQEPPSESRGLYQYIRMELCTHGDVEEFIKSRDGRQIDPMDARYFLFQMAFSLHVAGDYYGMKHYDIKLLNFFLQSINVDEIRHPHTTLRYGVGSHVFHLRMPSCRAMLAKLADYGTANIRPDSDGQPILLSNFTTIENTPPDYMILGDAAKQGYGHDCFGLGLCMLHLFTGDAPYEEILENVVCPPNFKKKLKRIWEHRSSKGYEIIRSVIFSDIHEDENGNIEGCPDEVLYDSFYRFIVLFGFPKEKFENKIGGRVWHAMFASLQNEELPTNKTRPTRQKIISLNRKMSNDIDQYEKDCKKFSLLHGSDYRIARARRSLAAIDGGLELLFSLISFDPNKRASPLDVINSDFMLPLRSDNIAKTSSKNDYVLSYMAYSTS